VRGRTESIRDYFDVLSLAVWKPEDVAKTLPRSKRAVDAQAALEAKVTQMRLWAEGVNKRFAMLGAAKAAELAKAKKKREDGADGG
jgi:hypothetical protein